MWIEVFFSFIWHIINTVVSKEFVDSESVFNIYGTFKLIPAQPKTIGGLSVGESKHEMYEMLEYLKTIYKPY